MRRALALLVLALLAVQTLPAPAGAQDDQRCIEPPEVKPDWEWAYDLQDGTERFEEVLQTALTTTYYGHHNVSTIGFMERNGDDVVERGRYTRFAADTPYPLAVLTQDRWEPKPDGSGEARTLDSWSDVYDNPPNDPPLQIVQRWRQTCPGDFWDFTTTHQRVTSDPPARGEVNESWQVRAYQWETVTVPAGSFEAMEVRAVRVNDLWMVKTWWAPEVKAPVKVEEGPRDAPPLEVRELSWFILDQRPTPRFKHHPTHPVAGDDLVLDASPSFDPDGNITEVEWVVNGETYLGTNITIHAVEEGTHRIRVFVTDDAGRTSTLGTTLYIPRKAGEGIAVDGPLAAPEGTYVRLDAVTPFDPLRVRWRVGDQVVGDGATYVFRMTETLNLTVDAFHRTGRVFTANHTVTLYTPSSDGGDGSDPSHDDGNATHSRSLRDPSSWPAGGSDVLALLAPLEGQVVPQRVQAHVWTSDHATLHVDGEVVWSGAGPEAQVPLQLEPGRHTLDLTAGDAVHTVNVTVSDHRDTSATQDDDGTEPSSTPLPWVAALVALALAARRRRT